MGNIDKFAALMQNRAKEVMPKNAILELGTIKSDYSLLCDSFPIPIPASDYLVCKRAMIGEANSTLATTETAAEHSHVIKTPEQLQSLKPGDRVLVAWVGNGISPDAVIIDVIN